MIMVVYLWKTYYEKTNYRLTTIFHRFFQITILSLYPWQVPPSGSSRTSWNLGRMMTRGVMMVQPEVQVDSSIKVGSPGYIREFLTRLIKEEWDLNMFSDLKKNRVKRIVKQDTSIWWKWTNNDPYHQLTSHAKLPTLHVWGPFSPSFNCNN